MKRFAFRFDVDTWRCMRLGVPSLVRLGDERGVKFTFFLTMGRSVSRRAVLFGGKPLPDRAVKKLGVVRRIGWYDSAVTLLFNPAVGGSFIPLLRSLSLSGHEFGLHGGRNHGLWMREAAGWTEKKLEEEVAWGLEMLGRAGISPSGFASPGWTSPGVLPGVLEKLGFIYYADSRGPASESIVRDESFGIRSVPTNILGNPGGVGYIESCVAKGLSEGEIEEDFAARLKGIGSLAVAYDHPGFLAPRYLPLLGRLIDRVKGAGFVASPVGEIAAQAESGYS